MSKVTHPDIEAHTFYYKGAVLQNWTENSSIQHIAQTIHT